MGRLWRESGRRAVWGRPGRPDVRSVPLARCPKACKQRPDKPVAILLDTKAGTLSTENVTLLIDNPGQLEYNTQEAEQKSEKKSNVNPWTAFCWRQMQIHTVSTCLYWDRAQGPEIRTGFFKDSGICIFFNVCWEMLRTLGWWSIGEIVAGRACRWQNQLERRAGVEACDWLHFQGESVALSSSQPLRDKSEDG